MAAEPDTTAAPDSRRRRIAAYAAFAALTVGLLVWGMRLDRTDLTLPLGYSGDALLILPMVNAWHEGGTHWHTDRLGFPGRQELYDFPVIDHLHFVGVWILGKVSGDAILGFNLYFLLTYPLATLTAMHGFRRLGLSLTAAGVAGVLFAFLPYHQLRGEAHYFLSAYFLIPPVVVRAIEAVRGTVRREWLSTALLAALISCAGAYYAFFSCLLLSFAGVCGALRHRDFRPLAACAWPVAIIVAGGLLNHLPTFRHHAEFGPHTGPIQRHSYQAETYGLKAAQMIVPIEGHRIRAFRDTSLRYNADPMRKAGVERFAALGVLGSLGLLAGLVAVFLKPDRLGLQSTGFVILFSVLFGVVGGLGELFNHWVGPQVRCLNRISIFVAFAALFVAFRPVDAFLAGRAGRARRLRIPALLLLLAFGILDTTDRAWFTRKMVAERAGLEGRIRADRAFFRDCEARLPGAAVYTLPYLPYPECWAGPLSTEHVRGYLFTAGMKWSYGAMRGREVDQLHWEVALEKPPQMLRRLVLNGFGAVFLDRRGYAPDAADRAVAELKAELGEPVAATADGVQFMWDLTDFAVRVRSSAGEGYAAEAFEETHRVRCTWLDGFAQNPELGLELKNIECERRAVMAFDNPHDGPRPMTLTFGPVLTSAGATVLTFEGAIWNESMPISDKGPRVARTLTIPPGRSYVRVTCPPPPEWHPQNGRSCVAVFTDVGFAPAR